LNGASTGSTFAEYPGKVLSTSGGMPHAPSGGGNITPLMSAFPPLSMSTKALRSGKGHRPAYLSAVLSGLLWSNNTRALNTPMKAATVEMVASSWMEALGKLSR
jgi:hypothetical protein